MAKHSDIDHTGLTGVGAAAFAGVRVTDASTQSVPNNTQTAVEFDTEAFDTDGFHDNAVNNVRLTVPSGKAGKYHIGGSSGLAANATGARQLSIRLNGTTYLAMFAMVGASGSSFRAVVDTVYDLAVGDYVELMMFQTSGGALNTVNAEGLPNFWMYKVG